MKKVLSLLLIIVFAFGISAIADELTAEDIITKVDQEMKVENKYMEQEMILISGSGTERSRSLQVWNKKGDENDKMMAKFTEPANIKGTGILMVGDDMWLYLPALGRVKRIAGSAKQGDFMGSDLTYEDMEALGSNGFANDYEVELLGEEKLEAYENETYLLKLIPTDEEISYSKLEMYVDKEIFLPLKINYYINDKLSKVLKTSNHKQVNDNYLAMVMEVEDIDKKSKTILKVKNVEFPEEIEDEIFTVRNLERGVR